MCLISTGGVVRPELVGLATVLGAGVPVVVLVVVLLRIGRRPVRAAIALIAVAESAYVDSASALAMSGWRAGGSKVYSAPSGVGEAGRFGPAATRARAGVDARLRG